MFSPKFKETKQSDAKKRIDSGNPFIVRDNCCGSGVLAIANYNYLKAHGIDTSSVIYNLTDIDKTCAMMSLIQLNAIGANAIILHGDSLTNEVYDMFLTSKSKLEIYKSIILGPTPTRIALRNLLDLSMTTPNKNPYNTSKTDKKMTA